MADDADSTLGRLKERREQLGDAADDLERAITGAGDADAWRANVRGAVARVGVALDGHVREVESEGGLYDEIMASSPRLAHDIDRLRAEHEAMAQKITELSGALEGGMVPVEDAREGCLMLLIDISRHRHRGADLLWEFYDVDIGPSD